MSNVVEYGTRRTLVVCAVMLAALMQLADTTIVNVALPAIDGTLGASADQGAWFVTAYIVANVIVIPLTPFLQSLVGRKRYFALSIAGFTIVSIMCGLAQDTTTEIFLRFVQGAFGGGMMVPAQQIIRDTFPPSQLGKSQSLFALAVVIGPTIGPTLGGLLTDDFSWRWVFFVNVLPGIAATILVLLFVRDPQAAKRMPFDVVGIGLMALGLGALQYVLDEGERSDWLGDPTIVLLIVVSALSLVAFVAWELWYAKSPAVALRVFRDRTVWASSIINFAIGAAMYGLVFIQPQYTQNSLGFTTTLAGVLLMVRAGTLAVLYPVTTWVVSQQKIDLRIVAALGMFVTGGSMWLQTFVMTTHTPFSAFVVTQVASGVGLAFVFVPINVILLRGVAQSTVPAALALTRLSQQIGASVGSAYAATLLDRGFDGALDSIAGTISLGRSSVNDFVMTHGPHAIAQLSALATAEAANMAAAGATNFFAVGTMFAAVLPFLLARRPHIAAETPMASPQNQSAPPLAPVRIERGAVEVKERPSLVGAP